KQGPNSDPMEQVIARDLAALASVPGVREAAPVFSVPFGHAGATSGFTNKRDGEEDMRMRPAAIVETDHRGLSALGLTLIAGRDFRPDEIKHFVNTDQPGTASVIVTRNLADELLHDVDPLGQTLYIAGQIPLTVVGVVEDFLGYNPDVDFS